MYIKAYMQSVGNAARQASRDLARANSDSKNNALISIANQLDTNRSAVLAANNADMDNGRNNDLNNALLDRLELNDGRVDAMSEGLHQVAA